MKVASRLSTAIAAGMLCVAMPLALPASPSGPTGAHRLLGRAPSEVVPSDTAKGDKGKNDKAPPVINRGKSLKGRRSSPAAPPNTRQYIPDQPWETVFFVDNDMTGSHPGAIVTFASVIVPPRR
jgi:hypothetical protein